MYRFRSSDASQVKFEALTPLLIHAWACASFVSASGDFSDASRHPPSSPRGPSTHTTRDKFCGARSLGLAQCLAEVADAHGREHFLARYFQSRL